MAQIAASQNHLKKAANCHNSSLKNAEPLSQKLLLFYTVECAMKYAVLNTSRKRTTSELEGCFGPDGHNLHRGLKSLRNISRNQLMSEPFIKLQSTGQQYSSNSLHQVWRYSIPVLKESENIAVNWLETLRELLFKEYL